MHKKDLQDSQLPKAFESFRSSLSVASPGRINLIGEHTDYNDGFVLPTAIDKRIYLEFSKNSSDNICNVYSRDLQAHLQFDLQEVKISSTGWHNYVLGVISEIQKKRKILNGFDCIMHSDLPFGAGLSSSAALECGMASGLNELFGLGLSKTEIVELSMLAEHSFVGTKCGIMDQFASVMSRESKFIFLDCRSLEADYIPADLGDHRILLLNSMVSHQLAESEYNLRRQQCEETVKLIRKRFPEVSSLRDVSLQQLADCSSTLPETLLKRATYVIEENLRVEAAVEALKAGDLAGFGKLMYGSHEGLRSQYEVSCPEIDFLVDFAKIKGIPGARMMGGGFGGCTINLIRKDDVDQFVKEVTKAYFEKYNVELKEIRVLPSQGTTVVNKKQ